MSYQSFFVFLSAVLLGLLPACTPGKPIVISGSEHEGVHDTALGYDKGLSILAVGRAVSDNAVDIYDPYATVFHVLPPSRSVVPKPDSVPYNHMIISRGKSVRVYALNTASIPDVPTAEPLALAEPVPLHEEQ